MCSFVKPSRKMWEMSRLSLARTSPSNTTCSYGIFMLTSPPQTILQCLRTWRLREQDTQSEDQKAFITDTTSSNASGSWTVEIWEKLKAVCWRQLKMCASVPRYTGGGKTPGGEMRLDCAVKENQGCWKTWKNGGSKEEYQKAKRFAKHAVHLAKNTG